MMRQPMYVQQEYSSYSIYLIITSKSISELKNRLQYSKQKISKIWQGRSQIYKSEYWTLQVRRLTFYKWDFLMYNLLIQVCIIIQNNLKLELMQPEGFNYAAVSSFKQRPSQNIRYLINRQLPKLIDISITEAVEFNNNSQTKAKALRQLKYTVLIAENKVSKYLEKIIKALVKIWQLDIEAAEKTIKEIMAIIGYNVRSNFYLPLMMNILTEDEIKNSSKNIIILLKLISYMLQTSEDLEGHLAEIIKLISTYLQMFAQNYDGLNTLGEIAITLTERLNSLEHQNLVSTIFAVFLNIESKQFSKKDEEQKAFRQKIKQYNHVLARKAGYKSVAQLHSHEVGPFLSEIIAKKQYLNWGKTSKDRFKFDTFVRNCQGESIRYLSQILTVMEYLISIDCDIDVRMDTLVLLEKMLENPQVKEALKQYATRVFLKILNVAIKWKVGKPQIKIRHGGVINMIKMIEQEVINQAELLECFNEVLPQIKSCIGDDWAPQVRLSCCQFLQKFLNATKQTIDGEQLKDLYVILLERLDDSQDPVRKRITTAINLFFNCKCLPKTISVSSIMQYMVNAIFIHYDDKNPQVRDAIDISLRYAARVAPELVYKTAKANIGKMKHKEQCEELIEYSNQIIEDKKSETN